MKRLFSILLMTMLGFMTKVWADNISIESGKIAPNSTKIVSVVLNNTATNYVGFQMDFFLPKGLSIEKSKTTLTERAESGSSITIGKQSNGAFRIVYSSLNLTPIKGTGGALINLCLKASADYAGGSVLVKNGIFGTTDSKTVRMDNVSFDMQRMTSVTVTVNTIKMKYGDAVPELTYQKSDPSVKGTPTLNCEATSTSPVGTYPIVISKGSIEADEVKCVNGSLIIEKAPLTISAGNYTKKQGDAMPVFKASYDGFKNNETEDVLTKKPVITTTATESSAPDSYPVTVSGADAQNYDISYQPGTLTVTEADAVIITAKSYSRVYGDNNPTFEYEVQGAQLDGVPEITCEATKNSPVGTYAIVVKQGSVKNYNVSFANGTLTVTRAPLTVSAGNYTKKQGEPMPEFKASYNGFKNGDTEDVLTKKPVITTTATESSAPGSYPVTVSGAEAQNYDISYQPGTLTVTEADAVIITAKSYSRTYGDNNPTFEYEVQGAQLDGVPEITCEATKNSPVGTYAIVVKQGTVKNYNVSFSNGTLTVAKAPLTISAGNYTKKQGDPMPAFKASYQGFKNNETEDVLTTKPVITTTATESSAPGEYSVTVSGAEAQNYDISYQPGTLTVTEADAVIITAKSYSRVYGDNNPTLEYEVQGAQLDGVPEITCEATKDSPVGTYTIVVKQGTVKNYNVTFANGTLTVTKAPLTISAGNYTKKQGDPMPEFKASYDGFKNNETEDVLTKKPVITTTVTESSAPGSYPVTVSGAEAQNYDISYQPGTLTVTEADAVIITAKSYSRVYGDNNPTFEYEVQGAQLDGVPEITCEAVKNSPVGTYAIVVKQGTVKNYNVSFANGTLTVTKAPLTISAGNYTKKQGDAMPAFKASYTGFKNNETEDALTKQPVITTTATESSAPGSYPVTVSGAEAQNYDISYQPGTLTVTEADAVIITAKSYSRVYGDNNPTFEYEVQGAQLDGVPEITCEATKGSPVGTYAIVVKQGTVKNYNVTFTNGTLTVTKAPLTVSAGNYTKKQGDPMPEFKASYQGFKNNDTEDVLTKKPVITTTATESSAPGEYPVTVSGAEAQNYDISYQPGTLSVTEADAVIITAKSYSRVYGDNNPTFEYEVQGAQLDGVPEITCEATKNSPVGTYAIVVKQGTVKNYNVTFANGTLTVTKAPLTVSAGNYTKKQGDAMPVFKAVYNGFKNNETEDVLTKKPVLTTTATESSAPGEYPVTVSGAEAQNYDISYQPGTLTVTDPDKKKQTIKWTQDLKPLIGQDYPLTAISSSGLPVKFRVEYSDSNSVTIKEDGFTLSVGDNVWLQLEPFVITAYQEGNDVYEAAEPVSRKIRAVYSDIAKNLIYEDGIYYHYTNEEKTTLEGYSGWRMPQGNVTIKSNVSNIPVLAIGSGTLSFSQLDTVTIEEGFKEISGWNIVWGSTIKSLILPSTTQKVDLFGCSIDELHVHCNTPPTMQSYDQFYLKTVLYVPRGSKSLYEKADYWKDFKEIIEEDAPTGIVNTHMGKISITYAQNRIHVEGAVPNSMLSVYDLSGNKCLSVKLKSSSEDIDCYLPTGVYVVRVGGASKKVVL